MNLRSLYTFILTCFLSVTVFGQSAEEIASKYLLETAEKYNLSTEDLTDWVVTDNHVSTQSGVHHIYLRQRYQGIEVFGADASVHIMATGRFLHMNNQFMPDLQSIIKGPTDPALSAQQAIEAAAREMSYTIAEPIRLLKNLGTTAQKAIYSKSGISLEDIPVELVYQADDQGNLLLAWDMSIAEPNGRNWWHMRVDAATGKILDRINWIVNCDFDVETGEHKHAGACENASHNHQAFSKRSNALLGDRYNVFPMPVESPIHGVRTIEVDPAHSVASPFGWHDTDGNAGAEYTITVGNNVWAQEDRNGNNGFGYSPDGGMALDFDFPLDLTVAPIVNQDAMITNLFYWNNIIHDVLYVYGFDEVAGNFQETNYGRGGLGSDHVWGDAQDGAGTNNANFGTPPDGSNPRMQMFLWTAPNPDRDGDVDNGIIIHEYGHGISNRLTGGGGNTSCLNNREQMGEGWSDWYGLMLTMEAGDAGPDSRGIGNYATNRPPDGSGIRAFPYSTNLAVNPDTYDDIKTTGSVHRTGSVWCAIIWEVTWALIDQYGFDPDFYHGTGGNNIAIQLITEGMKLQPCRPGFVSGRDAILAADTALYNGANGCELWNAFAKRGLGFSATEGSTNSRTDGNEAFDLPPAVASPCSTAPDFMVGLNPTRVSMCPGDTPEFKVAVYEANNYSGAITLSASSLPAGVTATFTPPVVTTTPFTAAMVLNNTSGLPDGDYTIEVTATDGTITHKGYAVLNVQSAILGPPNLQLPADAAVEASRLQNFTWTPVTDAVSYDLELATDMNFTSVVQSVTNFDASSWTSQALLPNTTYYWRVKTNSFCGSGVFSAAQSFTIEACGNKFLDSGGPTGEYGDGELTTYVICPDNAGEFVQLDFTTFDIEPNGAGCYDFLEVFDGDDTSAPSLGQFCGTGIPNSPGGGTILGNNASGCLTFVFDSDGFVTEAGWEADITCLACIAPTIASSSVGNASCVWSNDGSITATTSYGSPAEFILVPSTGGMLINTTGNFNRLEPGAYTLQIRDMATPSCISSIVNLTVGSSNSTVDIIYVNVDVMGGSDDGSSWANAFDDLQEALDAASACSQIWVVGGEYKPTNENPFTTATGSRDQSFSVDEMTGVFGGFAGNENGRTERDPSKNTTILSGDIGVAESPNDNAWHVVWVEQADCTFSGFTITHGQADIGTAPNNRGGGLYNNGNGGASNPNFLDCIFRSNGAENGGAVYNDGINAGGDASPTFINCVFNANIVGNNGGGMYNDGSSGGQSIPTVINSLFINNSARTMGGGMYNEIANALVSNSIFWTNTGGSMANNSSSPTINFSLLEEMTCPTGATCDARSISLLGLDPLFVDADGADNVAGTADDMLQVQVSSPAIEAGSFVDAPAKDLDNNARPQGSYVDLGPFELSAVKASIKVFLEGGFISSSGLMRTDLATGGFLPNTEPFTALGFTHVAGGGGETTTQAVFTGNDITDWVFVELRDKANQNNVIASRSALLQSDGDIVDINGISPLSFFNRLEDNYYITVRHLNHLGVLTTVPITLSDVSSTYDFTGAANRALGGTLSQIDLGGGVFGLPAGDYDHNGQVQNTDYNNILSELGMSGYLRGDLDLNGQVQNSEVQTLLAPNTGRGVQYNY